MIRNQKRVALSRKTKRKLLEPGYWGSLEDEELEIIQRALENNPKLSFAWGFQTGTEKQSSRCYSESGHVGRP